MKNRVIGMMVIIVLLISQSSMIIRAEGISSEPTGWAQTDIKELKSLDEFNSEIFDGYQNDITRIEFVYIAVRLFEVLWKQEVVIDPDVYFDDTTDIWAYKAATVGITSGTGGNKFEPDAYLSREQFATMIIRTLNLGKVTLVENNVSAFSDESEFSDWAKEAVYMAKANNIINGVGNNKFAPKALATKEQCLAIVNRIINQFKGDEFNYSSADGDNVLFTVNDSEFMLASANILIYQIKSYYESIYGATVWDMEAEAGVTVEEFIKNDIQEVAIRTEVLYDYAIKEGYEMDADDKAELIAQGARIFESYPAEVMVKYGFSLEQLQELIVKQGYSELVFEEMTKDMEFAEADIQSILKDNAVYQNMMTYGVDAFYDKVRVRHILIKTVDDQNLEYSEEDKAVSLAKIEDLLARAKDGEDFATLATENTEDPGSIESGGEYTFGRGEMVAEFEAAAYDLAIGEISGIVETSYGFHILKLEERILSTDEDKEKAATELVALIEEAKYELRLTEFDKIYATIIANYTIELNEEAWTELSFRD